MYMSRTGMPVVRQLVRAERQDLGSTPAITQRLDHHFRALARHTADQ